MDAGVTLLAGGDMGIGNTTPASAITAAITGAAPAAVTGRGTGLDDAGLARKTAAVQRALAVNRPDPADGLDTLAKVGGFEIGVLAGAMLAAAAGRCPLVVDGFIAGSSALIAGVIAPAARPRFIAAHQSAEPGHRLALEWLGLPPLLDLGLRLGEGTGAALGDALNRGRRPLPVGNGDFRRSRRSPKAGRRLAPPGRRVQLQIVNYQLRIGGEAGRPPAVCAAALRKALSQRERVGVREKRPRSTNAISAPTPPPLRSSCDQLRTNGGAATIPSFPPPPSFPRNREANHRRRRGIPANAAPPPSFRRRPESRTPVAPGVARGRSVGFPAFAGMTMGARE